MFDETDSQMNAQVGPCFQAVGRPLRVCFILPAHWEAYLGGAQYQVKFIVEALLANGGCEVTYVAPRATSERKSKNYRILRLPGSNILRRIGYFWDAPILLATLFRIRPDVIYQRSASAHTGIAALFSRMTGCKFVWHIANDRNLDGTYPQRRTPWQAADFIEKKMMFFGMRSADITIAQTKRQATMLRANFGREATEVIPNFQPTPNERLEKSTPARVLWIANWKKSKRPELFVRLASEMTTSGDIEFRMIGDVNVAELWQRELLKRARSVPRLSVLGALSQEQVNKELACAHLLVNTSAVEGFSNTFIQAWLREVPVAAMDADPDGQLECGGYGFYAHGSYETLKTQVSCAVNDLSTLRSIGVRARTHALSHYTLANVSKVTRLLLCG
jgi:glycosyltransferase involved in cell wall biosynthesis